MITTCKGWVSAGLCMKSDGLKKAHFLTKGFSKVSRAQGFGFWNLGATVWGCKLSLLPD